MSLSPIISVAAVSIRINIPVADSIDRHTFTLTLTHMNTTDMYCESEGACESERLSERVTEGERKSERE